MSPRACEALAAHALEHTIASRYGYAAKAYEEAAAALEAEPVIGHGRAERNRIQIDTWRETATRLRRLPKMRAAFARKLSVSASVVLIEDVGGARQPTITNDAEAVVHYLRETGALSPGQRLYYVDSEGSLDGIGLTPDAMPTGGFYHVNESDPVRVAWERNS